MPRSENVTINGKNFEIKEKRIHELEELFNNLPLNKVIAANNVDDIKTTVTQLVYGQIGRILGIDISEDNIKNAYPSELEAAVEAFINVNFFGLRRVAKPLIEFAIAGFQRKV